MQFLIDALPEQEIERLHLQDTIVGYAGVIIIILVGLMVLRWLLNRRTNNQSQPVDDPKTDKKVL